MDITEQRLQWPTPIDWFQYKIDHRWDAQLIFHGILRHTWDEVFNLLINYGLNPEDKIVHLNEFYPNWRGLNEETSENMRNWVWTTVLEYLINKSISNGAKAMFVFTWKESMRTFLIKHGFIKIDNDRYVKILSPKKH